MSDVFRKFEIRRVTAGVADARADRAATEEPLEIRLHGAPFVVIMRTPGADCELTAGFLFAERVVTSADDLGTIAHCTDAAAGERENVVNVTLADAAAARVEDLTAGRRRTVTNSSCGLCGRASIESLRAEGPAIGATWTVAADVLATLNDRLREAQNAFAVTGGLHAAGLFTPDGRLVSAAEDVGRHNAVDKVIGRMLMAEALPLAGHLLFVSGRTSFEIVQKAYFAGIPIVASISAPSSLAIELAADAGMTLAGFVRDQSFNIYSHPSRITGHAS